MSSGERLRRLIPALALLPVAGVLVWVVTTLPAEAPGLEPAVRAQLEASGVLAPVTAVLLNFRSYDTFLELVVLLAAAVAVGRPRLLARRDAAAGRVLGALARALVPLMAVAGAYLLWAGSAGAGGAFQAGALLGAAGIFWFLAALPRPPLPAALMRAAAVAGVALFLALGAAFPATGRHLLEYPPELAGALILLIEAGATLTIATCLAWLFVRQAPPVPAAEPRR